MADDTQEKHPREAFLGFVLVALGSIGLTEALSAIFVVLIALGGILILDSLGTLAPLSRLLVGE